MNSYRVIRNCWNQSDISRQFQDQYQLFYPFPRCVFHTCLIRFLTCNQLLPRKPPPPHCHVHRWVTLNPKQRYFRFVKFRIAQTCAGETAVLLLLLLYSEQTLLKVNRVRIKRHPPQNFQILHGKTAWHSDGTTTLRFWSKGLETSTFFCIVHADIVNISFSHAPEMDRKNQQK